MPWASLPGQESVCLAGRPPWRAEHLGSGVQALLRGYSPVRLSLLTRNPPRGPADGVVYPGRTCCLSGAGLLLQCQFRGCSHLSWAVLLNHFSQHQVRVWEHGTSCCRQPARLQTGSANPIPQQKGLWAADCQTLRLPPLRCSGILLELSADSALTVKSRCSLEPHYSMCGLQTSHSGIPWEPVRHPEPQVPPSPPESQLQTRNVPWKVREGLRPRTCMKNVTAFVRMKICYTRW